MKYWYTDENFCLLEESQPVLPSSILKLLLFDLLEDLEDLEDWEDWEVILLSTVCKKSI